jgi:hypothetical protein
MLDRDLDITTFRTSLPSLSGAAILRAEGGLAGAMPRGA